MRVLAIDIGSSSSRSGLFDQRGKCLQNSTASREYALRYGADGAATLDPVKLRESVRACIRRTLRRAGEISAVGASAFWHSLLGLDKNRQPITPIYMWADGRAATDARRLRDRLDERAVHGRTGCMLRASFWPAKLVWLRRVDPALFRRVRFWVSPADWIGAELFGASGTSVSLASATGFFNLERNTWDEELCSICRVTPSALAELRDVAAIGDGAAGNLGSGADRPRAFAVNVGTSAAVRTVCRRDRARVPLGLFRFALDDTRQVIGGAISNAGNLHRWCLRELRIDARKSSSLSAVERRATATNNIDVLPFWVAERAPTWPEHIYGTVTGLTQATTALDIDRAAQCAVFYRLGQILELTESATARAEQLIVSGGILRAPALVQLLADAIGRDVVIAREQEASLRGAAIYALDKLGCTPAPLRPGRRLKHDPQLALLHRERRARQETLEQQFSATG